MKILYHSVAPWLPTGYGRATQELAPRLQNLGYDISIQCLNAIKSRPIKWYGEIYENGEWHTPIKIDEPITVYPANSKFGLAEVKENFHKSESDLLFTHFDTWINPANEVIPQLDIPYVSYVIVDHYPAPEKVIQQVNSAYETISMTKFGKHALEEKGVLSERIPHGVDHETYQPMSEDEAPLSIEVSSEEKGTRIVDIENKFIFGMIAANMGDRKNIPNHMEAYRMFLDYVDNPKDILMYIHTDVNADQGYNLYEIQKELNIQDDRLIWGHWEDYGQIGDQVLNGWYNAFDVLLNCTYGESWGFTITEAMSTETPVIATLNSSMPEQLGADARYSDNSLDSDVKRARFNEDDVAWEESKGGLDLHNWARCSTGNVYEAPHGLLVQPSAPVWRSRVSSKLYVVHPHDIFSAMKYYYNNQDLREEHGKKAREYVINNYTWEDHVVPRFDEIFSRMEAILS